MADTRNLVQVGVHTLRNKNGIPFKEIPLFAYQDDLDEVAGMSEEDKQNTALAKRLTQKFQQYKEQCKAAGVTP